MELMSWGSICSITNLIKQKVAMPLAKRGAVPLVKDAILSMREAINGQIRNPNGVWYMQIIAKP